MHYFHNSYIVLYMATVIVIMTMVMWFRDIIAEGTTSHHIRRAFFYKKHIARLTLCWLAISSLNTTNNKEGLYTLCVLFFIAKNKCLIYLIFLLVLAHSGPGEAGAFHSIYSLIVIGGCSAPEGFNTILGIKARMDFMRTCGAQGVLPFSTLPIVNNSAIGVVRRLLYYAPLINKVGMSNTNQVISNPMFKQTFNRNRGYVARALSAEDVDRVLSIYKSNSNIYSTYVNNPDKFGYYLAGLLEGDGHISIPALFKNSLSVRVFNPRIVFTSHIDNLALHAFIQSELGNIGRFQISGENTLRYIIGDIKGIQIIINLIHGKLRTPKNQTFNNLIKVFNDKYSLSISESFLDTSDFVNNSWLAGFTESDGHFGIKYVEGKPKSETKRAISEHVTLKYRLDQRAYDKPTSSSMLPFMEKLGLFLDCSVKTYSSNKTNTEVLSLTVSAIDKLKPIVNYFDRYPLIGNKLDDYNKWKVVYDMIVSKEHLTSAGRLKIKSLMARSGVISK